MNISLRSSQSSYGDPRYLSTATVSDVHVPSPLGKTLVDGYRDAANPQEDRARYNPVSANSWIPNGYIPWLTHYVLV